MVQKTFKVAEIQLTYNPKFKVSERPQISTSKDAYNILIHQWDKGKMGLIEEFKVMLLNRRNRVLGILHVSSGGLNGTIADPRVIFAAAITACASGIILCHNHPSQEVDPSSHDREITKRLKDGAKLLGIDVLDHLIISSDRFYSFSDEGLL
jgi:DNA repair protein RadC